jgi:hypothetical protein
MPISNGQLNMTSPLGGSVCLAFLNGSHSNSACLLEFETNQKDDRMPILYSWIAMMTWVFNGDKIIQILLS